MDDALNVRANQLRLIQLEQRRNALVFVDDLGSFDHVVPTCGSISGIRRLGLCDPLVIFSVLPLAEVVGIVSRVQVKEADRI